MTHRTAPPHRIGIAPVRKSHSGGLRVSPRKAGAYFVANSVRCRYCRFHQHFFGVSHRFRTVFAPFSHRHRRGSGSRKMGMQPHRIGAAVTVARKKPR